MNYKNVVGTLEQKNVFQRAGMVLIAAYALFIFYAYAHIEAVSADESWFWNVSQGISWHHSIKNMLLTESYLGYGAFYWQTLKVLHSFFAVRMVWALLIVSVPFCIALTGLKVFDFSCRQLFFSLFLYFSCPLAWFTGKIIGPEVFGQALGCWGAFLIFFGYKKRKSLFICIGAVLTGLATGVKLYNIVFIIFPALYVLISEIKQKKTKELALYALLCIPCFLVGFIHGGGYIMIANPSLYKKSLPPTNGFRMDYLQQVLFREYIEWDLVNSGGMDNTIISVLGCIGLFLVSLSKGKNKILACSAFASIVLLLLSCCFSARFLGWYLLPAIFIIPLCLSASLLTIPILLLNFVLVFSPLSYQVTSKFQWIENVKNVDRIKLRIQDWESAYSDEIKKYSFVEFAQGLPFYAEYIYKDGEASGENQLIFISKRALTNRHIKNLLWQAEQELNGYKLVDFKDGVYFLKFESQTALDSLFDGAEDVQDAIVTQ